VQAVARMIGIDLMPWQRHVLDVALEIDPDTGLLAYRDVTVTVPRQAGKTTLMLCLMTWRALTFGRQRIVFTAQTAQDARDKWRDEHVPTLEQSQLADLFSVRHSNGSEAIRWRNGSLQTIVATTEKSGHGKTLDLVIADEYFAQQDARLEQALKPTMITRPQPQFWFISTAGTASWVPLRQKVDRGRDAARSGETSGLAYFEWSADDDDDPAAESTWLRCHPAIGHTIDVAAVRAEFQSMELAEFERAFLNRWTEGVTAAPIPVTTWDRRGVPDLHIDGEVAFALDMAPDRAYTSIAVAGPAGETTGVELVDRRTGGDWVIGRVVQLWDRWSPIAFVVDMAGPASTFVPDLEAAGVRVIRTNSREMAQACGRMFDAVLNDKLAHRGQPELTAAVAGAAKRKLGDAWAFSRSASSVDISPLVAATLALWGATTLEREAEPVSPPVFAY
jgi:phage terminase large subunit-like protein